MLILHILDLDLKKKKKLLVSRFSDRAHYNKFVESESKS